MQMCTHMWIKQLANKTRTCKIGPVRFLETKVLYHVVETINNQQKIESRERRVEWQHPTPEKQVKTASPKPPKIRRLKACTCRPRWYRVEYDIHPSNLQRNLLQAAHTTPTLFGAPWCLRVLSLSAKHYIIFIHIKHHHGGQQPKNGGAYRYRRAGCGRRKV